MTQYFSKHKKLWYELMFLEPLPSCTYGVAKIFSNFVESWKIMQFLMGINDEYCHSKEQILLMDPLPSLNKVYYMILKVEKQWMAHMVSTEHT